MQIRMKITAPNRPSTVVGSMLISSRVRSRMARKPSETGVRYISVISGAHRNAPIASQKPSSASSDGLSFQSPRPKRRSAHTNMGIGRKIITRAKSIRSSSAQTSVTSVTATRSGAPIAIVGCNSVQKTSSQLLVVGPGSALCDTSAGSSAFSLMKYSPNLTSNLAYLQTFFNRSFLPGNPRAKNRPNLLSLRPSSQPPHSQ